MGHDGRMLNQALDTPQALGQREYLCRGAERRGPGEGGRARQAAPPRNEEPAGFGYDEEPF
jgi:hypothetical protein